MKKLMVAVLILSVVLNLCACEGGVGNVSQSGDPMTYFASDSSWTIDEIESRFGSLEEAEKERFVFYTRTTYYGYDVPVFGESWNLRVYVAMGESNPSAGCFSFEQKDMSDRAFDIYLDKIVEYYTEVYGVPDRYYETSDTPAWAWSTSGMIITLQDRRSDVGNLELGFAGRKY